MAPSDKSRSLPKFGEWDPKDPPSAEGFTVIFNKARDKKKNGETSRTVMSQQNYEACYCEENNKYRHPKKKIWFWFCCF